MEGDGRSVGVLDAAAAETNGALDTAVAEEEVRSRAHTAESLVDFEEKYRMCERIRGSRACEDVWL
jgi:hypothetical protein